MGLPSSVGLCDCQSCLCNLRCPSNCSGSEVNGYIKTNGVNEVAAGHLVANIPCSLLEHPWLAALGWTKAQALRSCSPTVKRTVLSSGDVIGIVACMT